VRLNETHENKGDKHKQTNKTIKRIKTMKAVVKYGLCISVLVIGYNTTVIFDGNVTNLIRNKRS